MAEAPEQISQFPAPPSFYKLYAGGAEAGPPPPPPLSGELNVLATPFDTEEPMVPKLEVNRMFAVSEQGKVDVKQELLKLNKGLLFVYIDLLHILVENPSQYAELVTVAITCLQNMQHLINRLRPDQARQTLEHILRTQIQQKQEALEKLRQQTHQIQQQVTATAQQLATPTGDSAESAVKPLQAA